MRHTRALAFAAMAAALAETVMLLGYLTGIGTYASPMLAGLILMAVGIVSGNKWQWISFGAVSLLSLILIGEWELDLMFCCLLGWYPMIRPLLEKFAPFPRWCIKLAGMNMIVTGVETLVMKVLAPQAETFGVLLALLIAANLIFIVYDRLVGRLSVVLRRRLSGRRFQ